MMGLCDEVDNISIVMEYVDGRNLGDIIHDVRTPLSLEDKLWLSREIAVGCNWLHRLNPPIVHRDLKPENVMVTADFKQVKLCDFGLSCIKQKEDEDQDEIVGSPIYIAPEVFTGRPANEKSDVYGYGLTVWELWERGGQPFESIPSIDDLIVAVLEGMRPAISSKKLPRPVITLIESCWAQEPGDRPTFGDIVEHFSEQVVLPTLISDPLMQELWALQHTQPRYPFELEWDVLVTSLEDALQRRFLPEDKGVECLKILVAETTQDRTRGAKKAIVRCDMFGKFLEVFGDFWSKTLPTFADICETGWFHGSIDSSTASSRLSDQPPGAFLVRLSSNERNCLTLTKRELSGACTHQRIMKVRDKGTFVISLGERKEDLIAHPSLIGLMDSVGSALGLTSACPGSPFASVFLEGDKPALDEEPQYTCPLNALHLSAALKARERKQGETA